MPYIIVCPLDPHDGGAGAHYQLTPYKTCDGYIKSQKCVITVYVVCENPPGTGTQLTQYQTYDGYIISHAHIVMIDKGV
jgi:hypothetical protein